MPFFQFWFILYHISGLQTYYLSSTNSDGTDDYCEQLGWKRLQEYNPTQRCWKYLSTLAKENALQDDNPFEDELEEEDYYPSLPFAALFSCFKVFFVQVWLWQLNIIFKLYFLHKKEKRGSGGKEICMLCFMVIYRVIDTKHFLTARYFKAYFNNWPFQIIYHFISFFFCFILLVSKFWASYVELLLHTIIL